jgi:copper oxidase (laccase) domain-containing protein
MLNLWSANRDQLIEAGVQSDNVHVSELCTVMHPDLFDSYRRDGAGCRAVRRRYHRSQGCLGLALVIPASSAER